jgi:hypothetical protein
MVDLGNEYCLANLCLQNAFYGAIPNHPILKKCIDACIHNVKNEYYGDSYLDPTGPRLFGRALEGTYKVPGKMKFGYYLNDIPGGSYHMDSNRIIIHKCNKCTKGNVWNLGNNFIEMWMNKNIY